MQQRNFLLEELSLRWVLDLGAAAQINLFDLNFLLSWIQTSEEVFCQINYRYSVYHNVGAQSKLYLREWTR